MSNLSTLKPFKRGYDPRRNVKGRISNTKNDNKYLTKMIIKYLDKDIKIGDITKKRIEALAERVVDDAILRGKPSAIKLITDRIEGKVKTAAQIQGKTGGKPNGTLPEKELERLERIFSDSK